MLRAWLLGITGVVFICTYTYFNDAIMRQTMFIGNSMPISVFGGLLLFVLLLNPLLRRWHDKLALGGRELAWVLALMLVVCVIPGSGLLRTFSTSLLLPHRFAKTEAGWRENQVVQMVPERMLVDPRADEDRILSGFVSGLKEGERTPETLAVLAQAWGHTLIYWLPLILLLWCALIGLALVLHRQWSVHEQLPYPIASFTDSLLPDEQRRSSPLLGNRLFWGGFAVVLLIHMNNYLYAWYPKTLIQIPLYFDFWNLQSAFTTFAKGEAWWAFSPRLFLTVVAFAFFLSSDVALSLGIGPFIFTYIAGFATVYYGVSLQGGSNFGLKPVTFLNFGAYLGMLLAILYTGRYHYLQTLKQALFLGRREQTNQACVWGARAFLLCSLGFLAMLVAVGLDWQLAVLFLAGTVILFVVMSRIIAETGLFFIAPATTPGVIILGLLGARSLGPETMAIVYLLTTVLLIDPREALMPFVTNALKLVELRRFPLGRSAANFAAVVAFGLAIAVPATLYYQYTRGANMRDYWATNTAPRSAFVEALAIDQRLSAQGEREYAHAVSGWRRFVDPSPNSTQLYYLAAGCLLVGSFAFCRLRYANWPLHPVMFLTWATWPGRMFAVSFLIGGVLKLLVTKYGGAKTCQSLKPLMIGVIAGEMLGGVIPSIVGFLYYMLTNPQRLPVPFSIMPN